MIDGLSQSDFGFLNRKLILPLQQRGIRIFLFGSRSNGKFKKFSDIDLFYKNDSNVQLPKNFIFSILSDLEDSSLPYKVDLVNYADIAKNYLTDIDKEKIELRV